MGLDPVVPSEAFPQLSRKQIANLVVVVDDAKNRLRRRTAILQLPVRPSTNPSSRVSTTNFDEQDR